MKELIKEKLEQYNYKYSLHGNKFKVKVTPALEMSIYCSNTNKVIIKDKFVAWNFLSGSIEMNLKNTTIFNTIGFFIITIMIMFVDDFTEHSPKSLLIFLFLAILVIIWTIYYSAKIESFRNMVVTWIESSKQKNEE